jgi:hypothetical protein
VNQARTSGTAPAYIGSGKGPLIAASGKGHADAMTLLLKNGVDRDVTTTSNVYCSWKAALEHAHGKLSS